MLQDSSLQWHKMGDSANEDIYAKCFLNGHDECGPFTAKRASGLFLFSDLNGNVESHFKTLKIKLPKEKDSLANLRSEKGLILDRVNSEVKNVPDVSKICPKHRYCNGIIIISDTNVPILSM